MKKVCVSFKELYKENGAFLENGGCIDFYGDDDGNEYYDLRTDDVDRCESELIACDGEEFKVISDEQDVIILEHIDNGRKLYLNRSEYNIAVFE